MIHSMTGYGAAVRADDGVGYAVEIRAGNHRYLKLTIKLPEHLQFAEPAVDGLLRARLGRGSVMYTLRVTGDTGLCAYAINRAVVERYAAGLGNVDLPPGVSPTIDLAALAQLPGVCEPPVYDEAVRRTQRGIIERLTGDALDELLDMRRKEGDALRKDLIEHCARVRTELEAVRAQAPTVVDEYHERLRARVELLMNKGGFDLEADGLMREVAIYAERCDVSEEIQRLGSHLDQFSELCARGDRVGRRLEFLTQELLREANTIASKSNNAVIARSVVNIKARIDRLREQVQNVE
ncbi:MAG: YicC/YloC family endoribonuclease [Phycisphaerae bacterium]